MKKYTVTTPRGTFTRQTERTYTNLVLHIVDGRLVDSTWAGRPDLAQKARPNYYMKPGAKYEKEIFAVDQ